MSIRDLKGATVVITGASSGIGRATALAFARQGTRVVLAARRATVLAEVAAECEQLGARALAMPTDVTDAAAVRHLAQAAASFGGRIDVWVNNAGSGAIGQFELTPLEAHEQVLRLNLLGALYGAYAALPYFRRQPGGGVLINVNSLGAWVPQPYTAAYTASKFGLRGLAEALRGELLDCPHVHVSNIYPAFVDTPGFQHGANYTGRVVKPAPPVFSPQKVANAIVEAARRPRDTVMVGWTASVLRRAYAVVPRSTQWSLAHFIKTYLRQAQPAPATDGSLHAPAPAPYGTEVEGGWRNNSPTRFGAWWGVALVAGVAAGVLAWQRRGESWPAVD